MTSGPRPIPAIRLPFTFSSGQSFAQTSDPSAKLFDSFQVPIRIKWFTLMSTFKSFILTGSISMMAGHNVSVAATELATHGPGPMVNEAP